MTRIHSFVTAAALAVPSVLFSQGDLHPGASHSDVGTVHFATSCSAKTTLAFDRAVALLHSFEFGEARHAFTEVAVTDPNCAMAYWGIAMTRWGNPMAPGNRPAAQLQQGQ
ncbi:MAG: hypothetical protein M3Z30_11615 [Gemmatimonadota bacterium]|nr:hypothetical protein [Gemmatimonadota bacterium]